MRMFFIIQILYHSRLKMFDGSPCIITGVAHQKCLCGLLFPNRHQPSCLHAPAPSTDIHFRITPGHFSVFKSFFFLFWRIPWHLSILCSWLIILWAVSYCPLLITQFEYIIIALWLFTDVSFLSYAPSFLGKGLWALPLLMLYPCI